MSEGRGKNMHLDELAQMTKNIFAFCGIKTLVQQQAIQSLVKIAYAEGRIAGIKEFHEDMQKWMTEERDVE